MINDLDTLSTASLWFSYEVYRLFSSTRTFFDNLTPIEKYYSLSNIKPLLRRTTEAAEYQSIALTCSSTLSTEDLLEGTGQEPLDRNSTSVHDKTEGTQPPASPETDHSAGMRIGIFEGVSSYVGHST